MKSVKNGLICALWLYIRTLGKKACENAPGQHRVYSVEERLSDSLHFSRTPPPWSLQCQLDRPWTRWQGSQRHDNSDYERRLKRRFLRIWHYIYSWDIELLSDLSPLSSNKFKLIYQVLVLPTPDPTYSAQQDVDRSYWFEAERDTMAQSTIQNPWIRNLEFSQRSIIFPILSRRLLIDFPLGWSQK